MNTSSPIFIIGCPRSGNTLLGAILNKHPDLLIFYEINVFFHLYRVWLKTQQNSTETFIKLMSTYMERYNQKCNVTEEEIHNCIEGTSDWATMLDQYMQMLIRCAKPSAKHWGDKTPHQISGITKILEVYPNAKFIYTYRDPRAVVNSLSKESFEPATNSQYQNAEVVRFYLKEYEKQKHFIHEDSLFEVRYENLVKNPEDITEKVMKFLNLTHIPEVLEPANEDIKSFIGWENHKSWGYIRPQESQKIVDFDPYLESYLHQWIEKQGYEVRDINNRRLRYTAAWIRLLPLRVVYGIFRLYWERKNTGFSFLALKLPQLQR